MPDTSHLSETLKLAQTVDRFVRRIHERLHARALDVDTYRIGPYGGMILMAVDELAPTPIQEVTLRTARDKSQITRKLQELERKGLIARKKDPEDARVSLIHLTHEGVALVKALQDVLGSVVDELLQPLALADRRRLIALMERI